ncbi:MAG: hypothetical protein JWM64_1827, partial [Frankiales bacterium]|nr:hypothetical protein [Frankiales bacterium]
GTALPAPVRDAAVLLARRADALADVLRDRPGPVPERGALDLVPGLAGPAREAALAVEGLDARLDQLVAALPRERVRPAAAPAGDAAP